MVPGACSGGIRAYITHPPSGRSCERRDLAVEMGQLLISSVEISPGHEAVFEHQNWPQDMIAETR